MNPILGQLIVLRFFRRDAFSRNPHEETSVYLPSFITFRVSRFAKFSLRRLDPRRGDDVITELWRHVTFCSRITFTWTLTYNVTEYPTCTWRQESDDILFVFSCQLSKIPVSCVKTTSKRNNVLLRADRPLEIRVKQQSLNEARDIWRHQCPLASASVNPWSDSTFEIGTLKKPKRSTHGCTNYTA